MKIEIEERADGFYLEISTSTGRRAQHSGPFADRAAAERGAVLAEAMLQKLSDATDAALARTQVEQLRDRWLCIFGAHDARANELADALERDRRAALGPQPVELAYFAALLVSAELVAQAPVSRVHWAISSAAGVHLSSEALWGTQRAAPSPKDYAKTAAIVRAFYAGDERPHIRGIVDRCAAWCDRMHLNDGKP